MNGSNGVAVTIDYGWTIAASPYVVIANGPAANTGMVIMATVIAKTNWLLVFMLNSSLAVGFPSRLGYWLS